MYLMKFTKNQLEPKSTGGMAPDGLLTKDISKKDKKSVFTSDQAIFEIANMKKEISDNISSLNNPLLTVLFIQGG